MSVKITSFYILWYDKYHYPRKVNNLLKISLMSDIYKCVTKVLTLVGIKFVVGVILVSSIDLDYFKDYGYFIIY